MNIIAMEIDLPLLNSCYLLLFQKIAELPLRNTTGTGDVLTFLNYVNVINKDINIPGKLSVKNMHSN